MTDPLAIACVAAGAGTIGVCFAPGREARDLGTDLDCIAAWNAAAVVTLVEPHELETLGIARLGDEVRRRHMAWHHWPIQDFGVPDPSFEAAWPGRSAMLRAVLASGGRVLIHCRGGLGRSGMLTARLLVEGGATPHAAIATIRAVRPGAIETVAQERWVGGGSVMCVPRSRR